jgi:GNAT superfamily N-acetyltransferase
MRVTYALVDGAAHAAAASELLNEAWRPPALDYTPEYMRWQLSFPGPWLAPAVMAFSGSTPAGFAAATPRRVCFRGTHYDAMVLSFVCVRPEYQAQGIASGLYEHLLARIAGLGCLVITYTASGSAGDRVLRRAYREAGFSMHPIGEYAVYAGMVKGGTPGVTPWRASVTEDPGTLRDRIDECARQDATLIHSDPSDAQLEHYMRDPRPRRFLTAVHESEGVISSAWAICSGMRGPNGRDTILSLDSVFAPRNRAGALPPLLDTAVEALCGTLTGPVVVAAPSLTGFSAAELRAAGIRKTASSFVGFVCAPFLPEGIEHADGTTLEVI